MYKLEVVSSWFTENSVFLTLEITNMTDFTWTSNPSKDGVNSAVWWNYEDKKSIKRQYIFTELLPGKSQSIDLEIIRTNRDDESYIEFDLVREERFWFSDITKKNPRIYMEDILNETWFTPRGFDWTFYLENYPDLISSNLKTKIDAIKHYRYHGRYENRIFRRSTKNVLSVKFVGFIKSASGYGTAARNYLEALLKLPYLDIYVENIIDVTTSENYTQYDSLIKRKLDYYDVEIIVMAPGSVKSHINSDRTIWCWYWEVDLLTDKILNTLKYNRNDICVSPSDFLQEVMINNRIENQFNKITHWHLPNIKKKYKKDDDVRFYTIAQDVPRKNLKQLFDAYFQEFSCNDKIMLKVKLSKFDDNYQSTLTYISSKIDKNSPKIEIITDFLTDEEIRNLHKDSDVFVLAQHSEGWGIPHIEALLTGNPVVTVNYGSLREFISDDNSYQIDYEVKQIVESGNFYPKNSNWAQPDLDSLKLQMRKAYESYDTKIIDIEKLSQKLSFKKTIEGWHNLFLENFSEIRKNYQDKFNLFPEKTRLDLPKISIITSMKNAHEYLNQFIDDVIRQTIFISNCEWIIIDANSDDRDYKILEPFLKKYKNIIYQKVENDLGIYDCWNKALSLSTGEYITNMNCDDRRRPDNLEKMAELLHGNSNISLVYCDSYLVESPNILWEDVQSTNRIYNCAGIENLLEINLPHNNPMWRRNLHDKYGFFDISYKSAGDYDFWLRVFSADEKFHKHSEILGVYYSNPNGISTNKGNREKFVIDEENKIREKYKLKSINLCTVCDYNYLYKALAMYESIQNNFEDFVIHILCLDYRTYNFLKKIDCKNIIPYNIENFLHNEKLCMLQKEEYEYFCYCSASHFCSYLLNKNISSLTYIDSDIYFHQSIEYIFDEIKNKSIGLFRHRQFEEDSNRDEGLFNVGVVYFKNNSIGKKICNWWSDAVLYKKYEHLSTCFDQKYLDEFPNLVDEEFLFIDGEIGHGAPWHWQLYDFQYYLIDGSIIWKNKKQKLIFTHFSKFYYDNKEYLPSTSHHINTSLNMYENIIQLKNIYDEYYKSLIRVERKYKEIFYNKQLDTYGLWWSGDFKEWSEAENESLGYEDIFIVDKVEDSINFAKMNEGCFERDGVIIKGEPTYAFELLNWLKKIFLDNEINLIDFGGSLGSTYFQLRKYFEVDKKIIWSIVEQKNFVKRGKMILENDELKFFDNIHDCVMKFRPNCFISSGTLTHIKDYQKIFDQIFNYQFDWIIIDRISIVETDDNLVTLQIVPKEIYQSIYPCYFFSEQWLIKMFTDKNYSLIEIFDSECQNENTKKFNGKYKGFVFKKITHILQKLN